MSKLNKKDRASLCLFTFSDGRRCRTPRIRNHPYFCFDHAQKEARARAAESIGKDLAYFFSGDYLSANDLSTALARILPAVVRGDIKPKTARTVAYLAQTLLQSIRLAQHEYIEAFSTNRWRNAIHNSVNQNHDYLVPPSPQPKQPVQAPPVVAGLQTGAVQPPQPATPPNPTPQQTRFNPAPPLPAVIPNPVASFANGGEGSASSASAALSPTSLPAQQSGQEALKPPQPVAVAPSASRQEPRPAAAFQTGPSGLPVLAPLPPPKPGAPPGSRSH